MPFLKDKDEKKKKKNSTDNNLNKVLEIISSVLYYIKTHILKFFALFISYYLLIIRKGKKKATEMIGGMEVPALKDNYDLSI